MDFVHPCDHDEVHELLNDKSHPAAQDASLSLINDMLVTKHRTLFVRMKCTLTSKGRNINIKSAAYRVCGLLLCGHDVYTSVLSFIAYFTGALPCPQCAASLHE